MSIRDNLFDNPSQLMKELFSMIDDEKKRMYSNKLVSNEQWASFYGQLSDAIYKNAKDKNLDAVIDNLFGIHNILKSVKLPGDFEKRALEKFYITLDIPYEDYMFSDIDKETGEKENECPECEKEDECPECEKEDEKCMDCVDIDAQEVLAESVNNILQKIADSLGRNGNHDAAYLVERTIHSIHREAESGKLLDNK